MKVDVDRGGSIRERLRLPTAMGTADHVYRLVEQLRGDDEGAAHRAARALAEGGHREAGPELLEVLRTTENHNIRNAAAVALRELDDARAVPVLTALICDPRTEGCRGSLLYALVPFPTTNLLPLFVECVITGDFEERHMAIFNIEAIEDLIPAERFLACEARLEAALSEEQDPVNRGLIQWALDWFAQD